MGNLAVILAVGFLVIGSLVLWNGRKHTAAAQDASSVYAVERLAREAAQEGLQDALLEINDEVGGWPATLAGVQTRYAIASWRTHATGQYRVAIDRVTYGSTPTEPDRIWLTATGRHTGYNPDTGADGTTDVVLRTVYETANTSIGVPPSMRQAVQTDDQLTIRGNGCISGATHSNGVTSTVGNTFDVLGTGTSVGGFSTGGGGGTDRFTGGAVVSDSVAIPTVPFPPTATTHVVTGNLTLSEATDPPFNGTTPSPNNTPYTAIAGTAGWFGRLNKGRSGAGNEYVLYVTGDLEINGSPRLPGTSATAGSADFAGYARIYVGGKLVINGSATVSPVVAPLPSVSASMSCTQRMSAIRTWSQTYLPGGQSTLAFYVNGNIEMGGNTSIVAHLYSNSAFIYTGGGNPDRLVIGGITAQNDLELKGATMIYYTEANTQIINNPNEQGYDGLRLVSYTEHTVRS